MEYKILILRNNLSFDIIDDCRKITEYFKTRVPFPVTFDFKDVSIPLTVEKYSSYSGFDTQTGKPKTHNLFGPDTTMLVRMRPHFSPDYAVTVLAWDKSSLKVDGTGTSYTKVFDGNEIICLASDNSFDKADFTFKSLVHEIRHSFCFKLAKQGVGGTDEMDVTLVNNVPVSYYKNDTPEASDGNFAKTLKNIAPHFDKLVSKKSKKYDPAFEKAVEHIFEWEGGYVNNPNDPGGETNFGISKRSYPNENIKSLTKERAKEIYFKDYWTACKCEKMNEKVALNVFDMAVNMGVKTACITLQDALGVKKDGIIGNITLGKIQVSDIPKLITDLVSLRIEYYVSLPTFQTSVS